MNGPAWHGRPQVVTAHALGMPQWIRDERIIGLGVLLPAEAGPALSIPRRETIWKLGKLSVPPPEGQPIPDASRHVAAREELRALTGADWLVGDVAAALEVVDHLASREVRERYASQGLQIAWDDPGQGYYRIAATVAGRHVQCTGQLEQWLSCFVAASLTRGQAMDDHHPRPRPLDPLQVIGPVLPRLAALPWKPKDTGLPAHVIDTSWETGGAQIWAGVRARGPLGEGEEFLYGVRINVEHDRER